MHSPKVAFVAGLLVIGMILLSVFLIGSDGNITGFAAKSTCSGGMVITDGLGNYCYKSSGSCDASCTSCETTIKIVDAKTFQRQCSAGR